MPLYVGDSRVSRKNFFNRSSLTSLNAAWTQIEPLLLRKAGKGLETGVKIVLANWRGDTETRRFRDWGELTDAITQELGKRENYFFQQAGENLNIATVTFKTDVPTSSIGWTQGDFFENLGNPANVRWPNEQFSSRAMSDMMTMDFIKETPSAFAMVSQGLKRRAEQEYLMMNMVKGAMWDAAEVADMFNLGIAVRGTGLLAHMGIESGDPTKAQEFKNKTSKEVDLVLCEEMEWTQLGAVVHYDPRVQWSSITAQQRAEVGRSPMIPWKPDEDDWQRKLPKIRTRVTLLQQKLGARFNCPSDTDLKKAFTARANEYMEEDHEYRKGHYAPFTELVGPYIRLKARPDVNMVGDHDLFAFTEPGDGDYGKFMPDTNQRVGLAQKALQDKPTFQAQHGGIWYWKPGTDFNVGIKNKIMGAHGPDGDEPVVYIRPGKQVTAAYYTNTNGDKLQAVWSDPSWTKWLGKTHSGQLLLNPVSIDTE
jgi:hypothetical protein